jgi:wyosine [tRNA(Phe)-imidazoG37] synthetase (radical SAM superfamily)
MTPSLYYCTQQCLFCWRAQSGDMQVKWDEMKNPSKDTPEQIVEGCFKAQEKIVSGYKGNEKTDWRKFQEAQRPNQVAISLTGEPTLYEPLGELIDLFHRKGLTTFLVTKEHNMDLLDDYARLIAKANPTYIEAKAYMHIGFSNLRLSFDHMPMHGEVKKFANQLAKKTGYKIINEAPESRVVLLSQLDKPIQVGRRP